MPNGCSTVQKRRPVLAMAAPMSRIPSLVIGLSAKYMIRPTSICRSSAPVKNAPMRSSARIHGRPVARPEMARAMASNPNSRMAQRIQE